MKTFKAIKRPIQHFFRIAENDELVATREGTVEARRGDAILTGVEGEVWPIQANKFLATYDILSGAQCRKKPIEVLAVRMDRPFQVVVAHQDGLLDGKPGDWLIEYGEANFGIVAQDIFDKTYDILGPSNKTINIGSSKIRISDQQPTTSMLAMFNDLQNCLLGKDAAILRFHPSSTFAVGKVALYQPLDGEHPSGVWYEAKIARIRDNGYMELEPMITHYTASSSSAQA